MVRGQIIREAIEFIYIRLIGVQNGSINGGTVKDDSEVLVRSYKNIDTGRVISDRIMFSFRDGKSSKAGWWKWGKWVGGTTLFTANVD